MFSSKSQSSSNKSNTISNDNVKGKDNTPRFVPLGAFRIAMTNAMTNTLKGTNSITKKTAM
jgi:hypothetical protein